MVDGEGDLRRSTVQADAYATTHREAWLLAEAALEAVAAPFVRDGVRFASAGHGAPRTLPSTASQGAADSAADGAAIFRASADLNFLYT
jgi:hypothetical protein